MSIGGLVAGAGSVFGGLLQSGAAKSASAAQAQYGQEALQTENALFQEAVNTLQPYYGVGSSIIPILKSLVTPSTAAQTLQTLPGFQFQSEWGTRSAQNALAAQGLGGSSGPLATAISNYNQGLAGTYYMNSVNALQGLANMGENAAAAVAGAAGQFSGQMGSTLQGIGNAQASGILGSANALAGGIGGIGNALLLSSLMGGGTGSSGIYGSIGNLFNSGASS